MLGKGHFSFVKVYRSRVTPRKDN